MSAHVLFCRDSGVRLPGGNVIARLEGWCIASSAIQSVLIRTNEAEFDVVPYGFLRPDVGKAYEDHPNSARSGFRFSGPVQCPIGVPGELRLQLTGPDSSSPSEWHASPVNLDTSDVQTLEIGPHTRVSGLAEAAAAEVISADNLEARFRRSLETKRGVTMRLDIINKCNLRCVMCHFSDEAVFKRPTRQLTGEQFKTLFDGIGPEVSQIALSCGDEPLTSKFLPEILRYLATEHPHVAIEFCTNAMLMREPVRELLIETRVARLLFSIDAVTKPLLESIRVGSRYEQVVGNILAMRLLRERHRTARPSFTFNFVMMNRNIHEAPAFVRMAKILGAEAIDFRHMVPIPPYFDPADLLSAHPAKYNFYRERIISAAAELDLAYYLPAAFPTSEDWAAAGQPEVTLADFEKVVADLEAPGVPVSDSGDSIDVPATPVYGSVAEDFGATFCNRPFSEIMIRDQEEVLPCAWHGKTLGRLSDGKTLSEIFLGPEFAALRRNMLRPEGDPDCARCPIKTEHLSTTAGS